MNLDKLLTALDAAISPAAKREFTIPTMATAVIKTSGATIPSGPAEEVRKLDAEYATAIAQLSNFTDHAAKQAWLKQTTDHGKAWRAGTLPARSYGIEDFTRDYESKREAIKAAMAELSREAIEPAWILRDWFGDVLRDVLKAEEEKEDREFAAYNLPWTPSEKILALHRLQKLFGQPRPAAARSYGRPADMCPFLKF